MYRIGLELAVGVAGKAEGRFAEGVGQGEGAGVQKHGRQLSAEWKISRTKKTAVG